MIGYSQGSLEFCAIAFCGYVGMLTGNSASVGAVRIDMSYAQMEARVYNKVAHLKFSEGAKAKPEAGKLTLSEKAVVAIIWIQSYSFLKITYCNLLTIKAISALYHEAVAKEALGPGISEKVWDNLILWKFINHLLLKSDDPQLIFGCCLR